MSGYRINHVGKATLKSIELLCEECGYEEDRSVDMRQTDEEVERDMLVKCPNCDHEYMSKVWRTAPSVGGGDPKSDANLARMQKSLKERFIKKDLDQVRHTHGKLYDDSIRSMSVERIKKGEKPIE
jgi:hypothetical protein